MLTTSLVFNLTVLSAYLGVVLLGLYFPFTARNFESRGYFKYVHIMALVMGVLISVLFVGYHLSMGGYRRRILPIFCVAQVESAFWGSVLPHCVIAATFLTLVMVLLFKIVERDGWHCAKMKVSILPSQ